jgi:hypothetical protein
MSKTKVHKVTLLIVDHDALGAEGVTEVLENARYPNDCMRPQVVEIDTREVTWADEHPLNVGHTWRAAFLGLFVAPDTFDPAERAREKQASRDQDAHDIATGARTVEQVRHDNGAFAFPRERVRLSKPKRER